MVDGILRADWAAPASVQALATTRLAPGRSLPPFDRCNLGLRSGDDPDTVMANRQVVADALALPSAPVWLNQVHGTEVVMVAERAVIDGNLAEAAGLVEPRVDAAVTGSPGLVLAVLSADCLPVLLASDDGRVVGAVHAGWRGLAAGVIESAVTAMAVEPGRLHAWLGPAIGPGDYEVGAEVRAAFVDADAAADTDFRPSRTGHWFCDLYALARRRLRGLGVTRVTGGGLSTFRDARRFHSHRRDGPRSGRQASLIWIEDPAVARS